MVKYLLLVVLALVIPGLAWGPIQTWKRTYSFRPKAYVMIQARKYDVPIPLALAVWEVEASMRTKPPDSPVGARGAFQVMQVAAVDVGCASRWHLMREFEVSVNCGMRYLAQGLKRCGSALRAADYYYYGHCHAKVWGYGQDVGRLMMKHARGASVASKGGW